MKNLICGLTLRVIEREFDCSLKKTYNWVLQMIVWVQMRVCGIRKWKESEITVMKTYISYVFEWLVWCIVVNLIRNIWEISFASDIACNRERIRVFLKGNV